MRPVHVGCSGWQYASWRESFYPPRLGQPRWLQHYSRRVRHRGGQLHLLTRGNYSESELDEWAERVAGWRERGEVFAYFNNDWELFAPRNALSLRRRLE